MTDATSNEKGHVDVNSRNIIASLSGLLLVALAIAPFTAATANAATAAPAHTAFPARQITVMGVTSSGRIFNMEKPPSWLKPNTLVHPLLPTSPNTLLQPISPDTLLQPNSPDTFFENAQICDAADQCINNWNDGGLGTILRFWQEGTTNNFWNWWYEGDVNGANCGSNCWPFNAGTGINNYYQGSGVYKFAFAPNGNGTGHCISQQLYTGGTSSVVANLNTTTCACPTCQTQSGAKLQYFVLSTNANDPATLVGVGATNTIVAQTGNNSSRVWVGFGTNRQDGNGFDVYQVTRSDLALTWGATL